MVLKKQDKDYNCGVYALQFILELYGFNYNLVVLESRLKTGNEDGTSHQEIINFLSEEKINHLYTYNAKSAELIFPCLVNYQFEDDGHYGVALCRINDDIILYDPYSGGLDMAHNFDTLFYSKRYGKGWFLTILK